MKLRVMTYNIRLGIQQGVPAVAAALAVEEPELIALQEVGRGWTMGPAGDTTAALSAQLGLPHYIFVPSLTCAAAHYGHALLSAYPVVDAAFSRLPQEVDEPRTLLETLLETPAGLVRVISTHLSHIEDRPLQGLRLLEHVRARPELPTLVMGDLNATAQEAFIAELLSDTCDADPTATPTYPADLPERRIDYVLARDGELEGTVISEDATTSDHRYVATTWVVGAPVSPST